VKRLLVTGVSGFLGSALAASAAGWEVTGTYFSRAAPRANFTQRQLDLRQPRAVDSLLSELRPDAVIHTACSNRDEANIHAILPAAQALATACQAHSARLVHVSTDLVFDGEHAPYPDEASPAPRQPYGTAKAEAELAVQRLCPSTAIGRPSLIWALDPLDRQTTWLVVGLRSGTPVMLFTDEIRCPVFLYDLVAALLELAARPELSGRFNLGGRQALSRWDFGLRLLTALGLERRPNLSAGTVAQSGLVRARNLTLVSRRAAQLLSTALRGVDDVLTSLALPAS
jgi:dTDP-4-dehydrorhamnose reductase